jgi:SET domain-containing protein
VIKQILTCGQSGAGSVLKTGKKPPCFKHHSDSSTHSIDAKEADYLYIKESQIPNAGIGLYTAIPIHKDEIISVFRGKILSDNEAKRRSTNGKDAYFINMPDGTIMDSFTVRCFAKYANDAEGLVLSSFKNNSKITINDDGKVCIVATRRISVGSEIFCGYGSGYWKKFRMINAN